MIKDTQISIIEREWSRKNYVQDNSTGPYIWRGTIITSVCENLRCHVVRASTRGVKQTVILYIHHRQHFNDSVYRTDMQRSIAVFLFSIFDKGKGADFVHLL